MKWIILGKVRNSDGTIENMNFVIEEDELDTDSIEEYSLSYAIEEVINDYIYWSGYSLIDSYKVYENELPMDIQLQKLGVKSLFDLDGVG